MIPITVAPAQPWFAERQGTQARCLVGPDAKFVGVLTKMPDGLREKLTDVNERMMEKKGRKLR